MVQKKKTCFNRKNQLLRLASDLLSVRFVSTLVLTKTVRFHAAYVRLDFFSYTEKILGPKFFGVGTYNSALLTFIFNNDI